MKESSIGSRYKLGGGIGKEKKLVAMGTDGAAVMLGKNNGVATKVQDSVAPSLGAVHCFAHRLELAARDVVKKHPMYEEFELLLQIN